MIKANIRNGWRSPEERPEIDDDLLLVLKDTIENEVFIDIDSIENFERYECNKKYTILAWQYLPEWAEE